ncbi:unnamed protein product, partial [Mesorhabditis spiculigera]
MTNSRDPGKDRSSSDLLEERTERRGDCFIFARSRTTAQRQIGSGNVRTVARLRICRRTSSLLLPGGGAYLQKPPHSYVPLTPPKPNLLPAFDQDRGVNVDNYRSAATDHIKQIGVPVLPMGQPATAGVDSYGIVPPSQNKAYLQHLKNHRNFDTMKNLQSVNDCQICQMFLAAEGHQLYQPPPPKPRMNALAVQIPSEPDFDYLPPSIPAQNHFAAPVQNGYSGPAQNGYANHAPYPEAQSNMMPSPHQPQPAGIFDGLVDARHRSRVHVKDIFTAPSNPHQLHPSNGHSDPAPNGYSPRLVHQKLMIPAPDYDRTLGAAAAAQVLARQPQIQEISGKKLSGSSDSSSRSQPKAEIATGPPSIKEEAKVEKYPEARVTKDYKTRGEGDITVKKNDVLEVLESNSRWSRCRTLEGMVGFVPNKYINLHQ